MSDLGEIVANAMGAPTDDNEWGEYPPFKRFARLAITAIEKAGHRIVPVEPTFEMRKVCSFETAEVEWPAMLAAAPKVTP